METKFGSRSGFARAAADFTVGLTTYGCCGINRASRPLTMWKVLIVCGTPPSARVKSEAFSFLTSDMFLWRRITSSRTSRTLLRMTVPADSGAAGFWPEQPQGQEQGTYYLNPA